MSVKSLGYLGFNARDCEAWREFGSNVLGLMESDSPEGSCRFRMDSRAWRIAVHASQEDDIAYAGFEVADRAGLSSVVRRAESAGLAVNRADQALLSARQVLELAWFLDPIGTRIEVYYGATERFEAGFASQVGVSGFVTGEQGIGHVVLFAPDLIRMQEFYTEVLGLRLTDIIEAKTPNGKIEIRFMNCNARHHTVALVPLPVPRKLDHFMLEFKELDDMGRTWDRVCKTKTPVWVDIGRHSNDHMLSFYAFTPSGTTVECGWGSRLLDGDWRVVRYDTTSIWGHRIVTPHPAPPSEAQKSQLHEGDR
jgi:2,3-dihydroxybiphenyl 1,2-dioxygenase